MEQVDFIEAGTGPAVVLIHSSVAGAGQWRHLIGELAGTYHLRAINLFGYGGTAPWTADRAQTLADQAALLRAVVPPGPERFSMVGHSFGGSVAMKAAQHYGDRVARLVLIEPNPFYLLAQAGQHEALTEALALRDCIKRAGAQGDWAQAAAVFADYWTGAGSWDAMPPARRDRFVAALRPNFHEWDAVLTETTPLAGWGAALPDRTTVISARDTVRAIREVVALLRGACPHWRFETLTQGGHMAALSRPEAMTGLIRAALA